MRRKKNPTPDLPQIPKSWTLEELRWARDLAVRDGNTKKALACAIAIDKKRGLY